MAEGGKNDPSIKDVANTVTGVGKAAAGELPTPAEIQPTAKVGAKSIKVQLGCCAGLFFLSLFVGLFIINLFNPSTEADQASASTFSGLTGTTKTMTVNGKTITIPTTQGKVGGEESVAALNAKGQHITFEKSCTAEEKNWYINMRWPYVEWAWNGRARSSDSTSSLFARKKIIVFNPKTNKKVVTAICESGPAPWTGSTWAAQHGNKSSPPAPYWTSYFRFDPPQADGRVAGLAPAPMGAIGAHTNDVLQYGFAEDQNIPLGPLN